MEIEFSSAEASTLAFVGLVWNIVGTIYLGKALVITAERSLRRQSGPYHSLRLPIPLLRAFCEQQRDAKYGLLLLLIGFLLQGLSVAGLKVSWSIGGILMVPLPMIFLFYVYSRGRAILLASLRINSDGSLQVWRRFFRDIPEKRFMAALQRLPASKRPR